MSTEEKTYDDFRDFVRSQIEKMKKQNDELFNEINEAAKKYHEERCHSTGDKKEKCLEQFMAIFAESMLECIDEMNKPKVKAFGYVIDFLKVRR